MLKSVLPHINRLSLVFQAKSVDLTLLRPTLSSTIEAIKGYHSAESKDADTRINDLSEFNIQLSATQKDNFRRNVQEKYIDDDLVAQLENRFPGSLEIEAFSILDPSKLLPLCIKASLYCIGSAISTAECERCFSAMKRVKTELRNRLTMSALDQLLRISIWHRLKEL